MSNFFKNIIERHAQPAGNIKPRLPGVFEPDWNMSANFIESESNQFDISKKDINSEQIHSDGTFETKIEKIKNDPVFKLNTTSNVQTSKNLLTNKTGNEFHSNNEMRNTQGDVPTKSREKPISPIKKEIKWNPENKKSGSVSEKSKSDFNVFQIEPETKQEFRNDSFNQSETGKNKLSGNDRIKTSVKSDKLFTPPEKKEISNQNNGNGTMGLRLPNRFNQWMSEPVKKSQTKGNEISSSQTIKVNIGRIEVKAIMEQNGTPVSRKPAFKPKLSLDDYLNQRNGGKR